MYNHEEDDYCANAFVTLFCWCQVNSPTLHCKVHQVHYFNLGFNFADEC